MLEALPQRELERLVLPGDLGMVVEEVAEIELVVVARVAQMDVEDLVCKAVRGVAAVERDPSTLGGHHDEAGLLERARCRLHVRALRELDQDVYDVLRHDAVDGGAADVADPLDLKARQQLGQGVGHLVVLLLPDLVVLDKEYGKELPQLFEGHLR